MRELAEKMEIASPLRGVLEFEIRTPTLPCNRALAYASAPNHALPNLTRVHDSADADGEATLGHLRVVVVVMVVVVARLSNTQPSATWPTLDMSLSKNRALARIVSYAWRHKINTRRNRWICIRANNLRRQFAERT